MSTLVSETHDNRIEVRPFSVEVPDEALEDLLRRIAATRLPVQGDRRGFFAGRACQKLETCMHSCATGGTESTSEGRDLG